MGGLAILRVPNDPETPTQKTARIQKSMAKSAFNSIFVTAKY